MESNEFKFNLFFTDLMPAIYSIAITPWGDRTWPVWDEERKIYTHDRDAYEREVNAKRRKVLLVCNMCSFDCFFCFFFLQPLEDRAEFVLYSKLLDQENNAALAFLHYFCIKHSSSMVKTTIL